MSPFVQVVWGAFPVVEATEAGGTDALGDSTITLPGILTADLGLGIIHDPEGVRDLVIPTGWSLVAYVDLGAALGGLHIVKNLPGDAPGATFLVDYDPDSTPRHSWNFYRISGAHGDVNAQGAAGLDPATLTPAWGSAKTLYLAFLSVQASDNTLTPPSGWATGITGGSASSTAATRSRTSSARLAAESASENPATWGASGTYFNPISGAIAVRPA